MLSSEGWDSGVVHPVGGKTLLRGSLGHWRICAVVECSQVVSVPLN